MKSINVSLNVTLMEDRNSTRLSEHHEILSYDVENETQEIGNTVKEMLEKIVNKVDRLRLANAQPK